MINQFHAYRQASIALALSFCFAVQAIAQDASGKIIYPETAKSDQTDNYFGTDVADPYRWLEDDNSEKTKEWVTAENTVTFDYLSKIPYRDGIKNRITQFSNYERIGTPYRAGSYYFFTKNNGLQNQAVIYYQKGLDATPEVFMDPNTLSDKGTTSVNLAGFSHDRKYVAYTVAEAGSDWNSIYIMEVATKKKLSDKLEWVKFSGASWYGNGFFYSRYDEPKEGDELSAANQNMKVYYHKLGEGQGSDKLIFSDKENPLRYYGAQVTDDQRFLLLYISEGTDGTELWYRDLKNKEETFSKVFPGYEFNYTVVDNEGENFIVFTNHGADNYRVVLVDPKNPSPSNWKDFIPQKTELLQDVTATGGKLFCTYLKDASTRIHQYNRTGKLERDVELPGIGTVGGFGGEKDDEVVFYSFTSFVSPATIYKYNIETGVSDLHFRPTLNFNPDDYVVKQVFYHGKEGGNIPMFIVHRKDIKTDGNNPTLLYGYGGFNIPLTPSFNASRMVLLENGGIYALANLRGGSEYGEEWHKAGMLLNKQTVFNDFIGAAEYLIATKHTSRERLAIIGRSNGGLLVGACMAQRPDLFKVCFPGVGVLDMLRYHKFTVGWGWAVEYGSSDDSIHFKNLYAYSPLHNLKPGKCYPSTLITTADHDDRVVPAHSFKYAATIQEMQGCNNPVLIRIDVNAGHGGGRPLSKTIEEDADIYSFMFWNMGLKKLRY